MPTEKSIDVALPTWESGDVIGQTLEHLATAEEKCSLEVEKLIIVDENSDDDTRVTARKAAEQYGWKPDITTSNSGLATAREECIRRVDADWFLFLDDDVLIDGDYLATVSEWTGNPGVGAVAGRKYQAAPDKHPSTWKRIRGNRANTHAVMIRHEAVAGQPIPSELTILHDEYLRRIVDGAGMNWVHDHRATFDHQVHASGHEPGWEQGNQGGKFGLLGWRKVLSDIPFAIATGRNPAPFAAQAIGWGVGRVKSRRSPSSTTATPVGENHA